MTLRARLTLVLLAVVTVGLLASGVATYAAYRASLVQRVDQQLESGTAPAALLVFAPDTGPAVTGPEQGGGLPSGTFVEAFDPDGDRVGRKFALVSGQDSPAAPVIPATIADGATGATPFTTGAEDGSSLRYRVLATRLTDGPVEGYTIVVGIPLTEVSQSLRRLAVVLITVTIVVLAVMAVISWWTVKRGLRPLERIERTAGEIAEGNLSLRVAEPDPRTEVGRLGVAFNVMLERIEVTMEERRASEEALRRFLADASHELRTPLTSIRGYAELFRRGAESDPDDSALAIRRIEQESIRMGVLVDDLLFLARAGQGKPISSDPVDLAQIVDDAARDARVVDPTREIDLKAPAGLTIMGDEGRLRQVITNLVSNAITHTAQGSAVAVSLEAENGWAKIEVHDAGPGLTSEEAAHVFDPFYRADESRSRQLRKNGEDRITGAGLGLSIVAAITQAHGGTVGVVSDPQRGSTFKVCLPLSRREPPP